MNPPTYPRIASLDDAFMYFLDCQLATVEDLEMLARPSKSRLDRHHSIATKMIEQAERFGLPVADMPRVVKFKQARADVEDQ